MKQYFCPKCNSYKKISQLSSLGKCETCFTELNMMDSIGTHKSELTLDEVNKRLKEVSDSLQDLVIYKNTQYNNAMYQNNNIFAELDTEQIIKLHIDEKINRIKRSKQIRKNDTVDLLGYLLHLCVIKDWTNFDELKD